MAKFCFSTNTMPALLLMLCSLFAVLHTTGAQVGVTYGTMADNLPPEQQVVDLLKEIRVQRIRLYGPSQAAFQALKGTGIELTLGVPSTDLKSLASNQDKANTWVQNNVKNLPDIKFRYVVVGNGISPQDAETSKYAQFLLRALKNVYKAVSAAGLQNQIRVTTAIDTELLGESFPPSKGAFNPEIRSFIHPVIDFLVKTHAPLLVNLHPYSSYAHNKGDIPDFSSLPASKYRDIRLEYAVFRSPTVLVKDGQLGYVNVFDALVDTVYSALEKAGGASLDVVVSETGWPTAGGKGASEDNAGAFNHNLIKHVKKNGTPKRPGKHVETYIYNLFDENKKSQEIQKHWGIFLTNKHAKYPISFWSPTDD